MADMPGFHVLGVPGSLRARSLNRALLRAAAKLAPEGTSEPEVQLGFAAKRFDDGLELVDEDAAALVRAQLAALRRWARALHDHV
jgi:NAD(P)H-dependent FMN reductase